MSLPGYIYEQGIKIYRGTLKRSRFLHRALYGLARNVLVPLIEGFAGFHTVDNDPLWLRLALITESYEKETVRLVKELVKPGMVVLDIGAHVGYYTRLFSRLVGDSGRVIAFEPHPLTFDVLCQNVHALRNVTPVQMAVVDQEGEADLYDFLLTSAESSLRYDEGKRNWQRSCLSGREILPRIQRNLPGARYTVETTTVDYYLAKAGIERVNFGKMDIEGAEISAIRGMKQTIQSSPHLSMIVEYGPRSLQQFGIEPTTMFEELSAIGFSGVKVIEDDSGLTEAENNDVATQLTERLIEKGGRANLLCVKER